MPGRVSRCGRWYLILLAAAAAAVASGCHSPEDGRARAGGAGGDGGNYRQKPVHAASKLDGTKPAMPPAGGTPSG